MKTKDIAKQYGIGLDVLESRLMKSEKYSSKVVYGIMGMTVENDVDIEIMLRELVEEEERKAAEEEQKVREKTEEEVRKRKAEDKKNADLANMLITSGYNFDGYTITKYSGYISGDDAVSVDRGMVVFGSGTNVKDKLLDSLAIIRRNAIAELKEAAYNLGCNAVIGVDLDYLTLDPQTANIAGGTTYQPYVFCVTANGNAVIIEKNE